MQMLLFDNEGYRKAISERWIVFDNHVKCAKHNTLFLQENKEDEPCWGCYDEFNIEVTHARTT